MTDPTEDAALAIWWERLKAAPADDVEKAKELCASGKLRVMRLHYARMHVAVCLTDVFQWMQGAGYGSPDAFITLLDTRGPLLPPPGNVAASLLSGLCKCVHGAHVNNTNLEKLRDRCLDLLDLVLQLGHTDAFINTSRDSSELPERPRDFTRIMCRFNALFEGEVNLVELPAKPTEDASCVAPVKKERAPKASQAQPEQQGRLKVSQPAWVPETGRKRQGGDCTVPLLKSALEAQGYSVFVGESDIEGGASWAQAIKVAITDCQVFIPVCSETYGATKWTFRELHAADEANKEILPLWHSGDYPPEPVSMYLGHVQRLPRGNQPLVQADFQSLVSDLVAAVKKVGGPAAGAGGGCWLQGLALDQGRKRI
ncbi:hypothetical protein V8C86DRAFT_2845553 [Haematococcus lacustris]